MHTKLCIFDLDGTLIDSLYDLADAMNHALEKNGMPTHSRKNYRMMVGSGISVLADRAMVVPEGTESSIKETVLRDFNAYYAEHCLDLTRPYERIPGLLTELDRRHIRYAVLSNKPDSFAEKIVEALFPEHKFAAVWGKKDEFPRKPDPASVFALMSSLGVEPFDCLYIGDSSIDIQTAKNAGLRNVGVSWGFRKVTELRMAGANYIATTPADILSRL